MIDEGYIKFDLEWIRDAPPERRLTAELNRWRQPLHAAGLIGHYADAGIGYGNMSARARDGGHFVITGTQTGRLTQLGPEHFVLVTEYDIGTNRVVCRGPLRASSESMTHAAIYELDETIAAVVHVHSAVLWQRHLGRLPTTDVAVPYGTPEMARELRRLHAHTGFAQGGIAVMGGHEEGILGCGRSVGEAARRILRLAGDNQVQDEYLQGEAS